MKNDPEAIVMVPRSEMMGTFSAVMPKWLFDKLETRQQEWEQRQVDYLVEAFYADGAGGPENGSVASGVRSGSAAGGNDADESERDGGTG